MNEAKPNRVLVDTKERCCNRSFVFLKGKQDKMN